MADYFLKYLWLTTIYFRFREMRSEKRFCGLRFRSGGGWEGNCTANHINESQISGLPDIVGGNLNSDLELE